MGLFNRSKEKKVPLSTKIKNFITNREKPESFTKRWVQIILWNAIIWVYLSYGLAFFDKGDIAEQLSITVIKIIIYTFIPYLCKSLFENIFKYGNFKIHTKNIEDENSYETNTKINSDTSEEDCAG